MMYRVRDGKIVERFLPKTGDLLDGRSVSNYHCLPEEILEAEGWLPVEEHKPEYDPATEQLIGTETIKNNKVVVSYTVEALPEPEPEPLGEIEVLKKALLDGGVLTEKDLTDAETSIKEMEK
jgi:hypothetical protein